MHDYFTLKEIQEQPEVLKKVLSIEKEIKKILPLTDRERVAFIGCGSSYYLPMAVAYHVRRKMNIPAYALTGFGTLRYPNTRFEKNKDYFIIAISRSGESSETVSALESLKDKTHFKTASVTCEAGSTITKLSDTSLILEFVDEKSIVMTQSVTSMLLSLQIAMEDKGLEVIPELLEEVLDNASDSFDRLNLNEFEHFIYLGYDEYLGIANEGALKIREMALSNSETYETLEYRHGPKSLVAKGSLIFFLPSSESFKEEERLGKEMQQLGATTVNISPWSSDAFNLWIDTKLDVVDRSDMVLRLVPLQVAAFKRAIQRGINPDKPINLTKSVRL
ncbi:MAG TPA: SIS domain-containing protein [candidate division WOR-3 bacterium]|uniref:SIS domain-containing protein n=1 Tax=candidate division WOR-3 bacterium TaxID=2052148 RepID=A0A7C5HBF4_UNCW3|nr:SIS domain-containing protein [candidate division WOR-3 bacterium]